MSVTVGVRELRENLKDYLARASAGEEVVITERGKPVARLLGPSKLDELIAQGKIRPAQLPKSSIRLPKPIELDGPPSVSEVLSRDKQ